MHMHALKFIFEIWNLYMPMMWMYLLKMILTWEKKILFWQLKLKTIGRPNQHVQVHVCGLCIHMHDPSPLAKCCV